MAMNGQPPVHLNAAKTLATRDFIEIPSLADRGCIVQAQKVFGKQRSNEVLDDLQGALVA